ncbi:MAG: carbohydrate kinase [Candidatus Goldbacteria bacterium]|nr:carbohydrate kinase [Candidatus Goldiibacteriota bacterium]
MAEVITVGEILADFVPAGGKKILQYRLNPGGAPSNVAINLSRWGIKSGIISKIGDDFIGDFLLDFLKKNKVDTACVYRDIERKTGLVFVFLDEKGERDFSFYGEPSADQFLNEKEIKKSYIKQAKMLHFGSIGMMNEISRKATLKAINVARDNKIFISYDPNVRLNLWEGRHTQARQEIKNYFKHADVIKISDDELQFLFDSKPEPDRVKRIFRKNQIVFISAGAKGCYVYRNNFFKYVSGYKVKVKDTTGAGDAFMAGVIFGILKNNGLKNITNEELTKIAGFANKKGAEAVQRKGAV